MKLNCQQGNIQCGGKCQPEDWNCEGVTNKVASKTLTGATQELQRGALLGEGAYGKVYDSVDGKSVIKVITDEDADMFSELVYTKEAHDLGVGPAVKKLSENSMQLEKFTGPTLKAAKSISDKDAREILSLRRKLHENGLVHNDLHSENIMRATPDGDWKIIDFGSTSNTNAADLLSELADDSEYFAGTLWPNGPDSSPLSKRYYMLAQQLDQFVSKRGNGSRRAGLASVSDSELKDITSKYYEALLDGNKAMGKKKKAASAAA